LHCFKLILNFLVYTTVSKCRFFLFNALKTPKSSAFLIQRVLSVSVGEQQT
jgi:hypothetical protein